MQDTEKASEQSSIDKGNVNVQILEAHSSTGFIGKLWKAVQWLDSYGVEARGVERVLPEDQLHTTIWDCGFLWMSANFTISTFSLGSLGTHLFGLGLTDACLTIVFFNLLCTIPVALFSIWGCRTGLRQMMIGRYSFGYAAYFPIILNCIACVGWSTINTIVGARALQAVSAGNDSHNLPLAAGVIIIAAITAVVALFGYKFVHAFERYASIPVVIISLILIGQAAPYVHASMSPPGHATMSGVLSFGAAIAGFSFGWSSLAADYTVNFPRTTPGWKIFGFVFVGLNIPLIWMQVIGAAVMTTFEKKSTWGEYYDEYDLGGALWGPLSPMRGFGRFLLVILALSIVANNIPNMYSFALTFQAFGYYAQQIPRLFLVLVGTVIYVVLAIVGASNFEAWLDTLLLMLAYWLAIYITILVQEHYIFRKGKWSNYDLENYNSYKALPIGIAAGVTCAFGICGAVLGMSQEWYVGVISKKIGAADIGFELSMAFSCVVYPIARTIELKVFGK